MRFLHSVLGLMVDIIKNKFNKKDEFVNRFFRSIR